MTALPIGVAQRCAPGESVCGDSYAIITERETALIALADGLGHGPAASLAATRFCDVVRDRPHADLEELLRAAHVALAGTRGAAAALARVDFARATLEFSGVGNVELRARSRQPIAPPSVPGTIGGRLRRTLAFRHALHASDLLLLHTDGIAGITDLTAFDGLLPQRTADLVLAKFATGKDDATCVAVRVGRGVQDLHR